MQTIVTDYATVKEILFRPLRSLEESRAASPSLDSNWNPDFIEINILGLTVFYCGLTGTFPGKCQETETCMVRTCHSLRRPLQNHPLGHLGGWTTLWSAEEMLDGQRKRVDSPAHARSAHIDRLQLKTGRGSLPDRPPCLPATQSVKGLNCTELSYIAGGEHTLA